MVRLQMVFNMDEKTFDDMDNARLEAIEKAKQESDSTIRNYMVGTINLKSIAKCMESYDSMVGFKKRQVILEVPAGKTVKYVNELNDTLVAEMMAKRSVVDDTE